MAWPMIGLCNKINEIIILNENSLFMKKITGHVKVIQNEKKKGGECFNFQGVNGHIVVECAQINTSPTNSTYSKKKKNFFFKQWLQGVKG